ATITGGWAVYSYRPAQPVASGPSRLVVVQAAAGAGNRGVVGDSRKVERAAVQRRVIGQRAIGKGDWTGGVDRAPVGGGAAVLNRGVGQRERAGVKDRPAAAGPAVVAVGQHDIRQRKRTEYDHKQPVVVASAEDDRVAAIRTINGCGGVDEFLTDDEPRRVGATVEGDIAA